MTKTPELGGNQEVTKVQPPIFKWAPTNETQMTFSTDHFPIKCQLHTMQPKTS